MQLSPKIHGKFTKLTVLLNISLLFAAPVLQFIVIYFNIFLVTFITCLAADETYWNKQCSAAEEEESKDTFSFPCFL